MLSELLAFILWTSEAGVLEDFDSACYYNLKPKQVFVLSCDVDRGSFQTL